MFRFLPVMALVLMMTPVAHAIDRDTELEILRLENLLNKDQQRITQLLKDVRQLQRENRDLKKEMEETAEKTNRLVDDFIRMQNVDVANLKSFQSGILGKLTPLDWGVKERDCPSIGSKHQHVQTVKREDGRMTLRYLCFDGKTLHLGTEINGAP